MQLRFLSLLPVFFLFMASGVSSLKGDTTHTYPLVAEYTTESAKAQRLAFLEQELGIADASDKISGAYAFVKGFYYENPATQPWEKALQGAEYLDLLGNDSGTYHLMRFVTLSEAPYPDFGLQRKKALALLDSENETIRRMAHAYLGDLFYGGYGVVRDYVQAREYYRQCVALGQSTAYLRYAYMLANGFGGREDKTEALVWYKKALEAGREEEWLPGVIERLEQGTHQTQPPNFPTTPQEFDLGEWHRRAEAGSSIAAAELAVVYRQGRGVFPDTRVASYWEARALAGGFQLDLDDYQENEETFWKGLADQGSGLGKSFTAHYLDYKNPETRNRALQLANDAIEGGYPRGYYRRAYIHLNGEPQDKTQHIEDLLAASEMGYTFADEQLCYAYYNGKHADRDYDKAVYYARRSDQLHGPTNVLGVCYLFGHGVEKDQSRAVSLFQKSVAQGGNRFPFYNLARCYLNGWGVEKNLEEAKAFAKLAADSGNETAGQLLADIEAGNYDPRTPPEPGSRYAVAVRYGSQLPHYGLFEVENVTELGDFREIDGALWATGKVKQGKFTFVALLRTKEPGDAEATWELLSVVPEGLNAAEVVYSNGIWLAYGDGSDSLAFTSTDGRVWNEHSMEESFSAIYGTEKGFVGVSKNGRFVSQFSRDGVNWEPGMELQLFQDHLEPAGVGNFSVSGGWVIHVPSFPFYGNETLTEAPVYISNDGIDWYALQSTRRDENMNSGTGAMHVGEDFVLFSLHRGSHGGRLMEFRNGQWGRSIKMSEPNAIHHFLDVGGLVFGTESHYTFSTGNQGGLKYTGYHSGNSRSNPEDLIPAFMDRNRIYQGQELPMWITETALHGKNLILGNRNPAVGYFYIDDFQKLPAQTGDLKAVLGNQLEWVPEEVPLRFTTEEEATRQSILALRRRADAGSTEAGVELGSHLMKGTGGLRQNSTLGLKYLEAAAKKGDGSANAELAKYWASKDKSLAEPYYKAAVNAGHEEATFDYAYRMAYIGFPGRDLDRGKAEAIVLLQPLANQGNRKAEGWIEFLKVSESIQDGNRTIESVRKAWEISQNYDDLPMSYVNEKWAMEKLADLGDPEGIEWRFNQALQANSESAITTWLPRLAETGSPKGLFNRGVAKVKGIYGFEQEVAVGMAEIELAAEQGFVPAIQDIARNYRAGSNGLEQNLEVARSWAEKAEAAGETEWAQAFLTSLDTLEARANQEIAVDGQVRGLPRETFDFLSNLQNESNSSQMAQTHYFTLFTKIWYDAEFSPAEEDLVAELAESAGISVSDEAGETLTFTKVPLEGDREAFRKLFPTPFPASDPNYPLNFWGDSVTGGPTLYFVKASGVKDQARDAFLRALYQQISQLVQQAQQSNNNYPLTQFNNDLVNRAKALEPAKGREFASLVYAMIRDDIQANPALLNMFSSLNTFAESPLPESNP